MNTGHRSITFDVDDDVLALGLTVACFVMEGVDNRESLPEFELYQEQVVKTVLRDLSSENIKGDPLLRGFRLLHERAGCANRKTIAASENLLKHLLKTGCFLRVNLLVDIYNLVSLSSRLSLGAHDVKRLGGNVRLKMTTGQEGFWPIGSQEPDSVRLGEYAYIDDDDDIICRLEVRQVEKTKVTLDTRECFYIVQGNPAASSDYLKAVTEDLIELTRRFCGGKERILYKPW
ncbi:MAG: tRNA ligase [Firmicutes bacterium]|nr:tRNA ligase [Bacillota bacterium]